VLWIRDILVRIRLLLIDDGRIQIRSRIHTCDLRIRMRIRETQKHTDPTDTDPDPQHWFLYIPGVTKEHITNNSTLFNSNIFFTIIYYLVSCYENNFVNKCNIKM
jgi:hypothetical protein